MILLFRLFPIKNIRVGKKKSPFLTGGIIFGGAFMSSKGKGILFFIVGFIILLITPFIIFSDGEIWRVAILALVRALQLITVSWLLFALGMKFYFKDKE